MKTGSYLFCLILLTVLFGNVAFFLFVCFVIRDLCRSGCRQNFANWRSFQVLYILRNLKKFENSIKIHFFSREIAANFNNFQLTSTSAQKLLLT